VIKSSNYNKPSSQVPLQSPIGSSVSLSGTIHASLDSRRPVIPSGCRTGLECPAATRSECAFSSRLSPRTEDSSVSLVVPGRYLTICCALYVRPSFTADMYWLPQTVLTVFIVTFVRWSCSIYCNSATLIIFIATTTVTVKVWTFITVTIGG